jgi:hypothetical protein
VKRGVPNGRYRCTICGLGYAQAQGLTRHHRETHEASLCTRCNDFKWGRPYRYKEHLKKRHPDIDPNVALEEATKTRRRTVFNTKGSPRQRASPSTAIHDRWGRVETGLNPSLPPPGTVVGIAPISPPSMSDYDPHPGPAEKTVIQKHTHEGDYRVQNQRVLACKGGCIASAYPLIPRNVQIPGSTPPVDGHDSSQGPVHSKPLQAAALPPFRRRTARGGAWAQDMATATFTGCGPGLPASCYSPVGHYHDGQ